MNKYSEYKEAYKALIKTAIKNDLYGRPEIDAMSTLKRSDIKKQVDLDKGMDQFADGPDYRESPVLGSIIGALLGATAGFGAGGITAGAIDKTSLGRGFFESDMSPAQKALMLLGTGVGGALGGMKGHSYGTAKLEPWEKLNAKFESLEDKADDDYLGALKEQRELMDKMLYYIGNTKKRNDAKSIQATMWSNGWM